jgi:hypothetical protein
MRKPVLTLGAGALVVLALSGLTGCVGQVQDAIEQGTEQAIEDAARDSGIDLDVNTGGSAPEGWPDEVPLPDGDISFSGNVDGRLSVIMVAEQSAIDGAIEEMRANGFTDTSDFSTDEGRLLGLENGTWSVSMVIGEDPTTGKASFMCTVAPVTP